MIVKDSIHGSLQITTPVILDLINSTPFQRLKSISQDGAAHYIQPFRNVTRYDHSIGTWYLATLYKRPIEEQIASLLHDIPHTAFSHVIDIVMNDPKHEYHDKFLKQVILNSEIPDILNHHKIKLADVLNKNSFPLLNNNLPDISFDRLDYFLRDGLMFGLLPKQTVALFLAELKEKDEKLYFEDKSIASLFAVMFLTCSRLIWLDPTSHGGFFLIANSLRIALQKGYITEEDFFKTDDTLMHQLKQTNDPEILSLLSRLEPGREFSYAPEDQAEFFGANKPRSVDPWVLDNKKLKKLSEIIPGMKEYFEEYLKTHTHLGVIQH